MSAEEVLRVCRYPSLSIFRPHSSVILSITKGSTTTVTTFTDHHLITGTIVRLTISPNCGMPQINQKTGTITVIDATSFSIPINSLSFDAFVIPEDPDEPGTPPAQQQPCSFVVPIGEDNRMLTAAVQNILPI